jgi:hypothetical protein
VNLFFLRDDKVGCIDKAPSRHAEVDNTDQDILAREADVGSSSFNGEAFSARVVE